jgi:uncharacterized RDD family membrane protein YckC
MSSSGEGAPNDAEAEALARATEAFGSEVPGRPRVATQELHPLPDGVELASPWRRLAAWALEFVLFVVTLGVGWCIWAFTLGDSGQTPAKKLLGLRVLLDDQAHSAGLSRMFLMRWFVGALVVPIVALLTLGIILLMPFWSDRNRNLWDKISTCVVVYDPDQRWDGVGEGISAAHRGSGGPWRR